MKEYNINKLIVYRLGETFDYRINVEKNIENYLRTKPEEIREFIEIKFNFTCSSSQYKSDVGKIYKMNCIYDEFKKEVTVQFKPEYFYYNNIEKVYTKERIFYYSLWFEAKYFSNKEIVVVSSGLLNLVDSLPIFYI